MWVRRPRLPHTISQDPCAPTKVVAPLTNTVHQTPTSRLWDMPDTDRHPHREAMDKQHTHNQSNRAVCPSATHMSTKWRDRTAPDRDATTAAQTHWDQSPIWRGHTKPTTSPKEGKGRGTSAKSSVLILTCVPLPHLVLPLSGCACSGTPTMATRGEARGHP